MKLKTDLILIISLSFFIFLISLFIIKIFFRDLPFWEIAVIFLTEVFSITLIYLIMPYRERREKEIIRMQILEELEELLTSISENITYFMNPPPSYVTDNLGLKVYKILVDSSLSVSKEGKKLYSKKPIVFESLMADLSNFDGRCWQLLEYKERRILVILRRELNKIIELIYETEPQELQITKQAFEEELLKRFKDIFKILNSFADKDICVNNP